MNTRNILHPLDVPWEISPSVSDIRLTVVENGDAIASFDVAVLPLEGNFTGGSSNRRVEVLFKGGQWSRTTPAFSDGDTVPPGLFDRSRLPQLRSGLEADAIEEYLVEFRTNWVTTGRCPDPGAYQVEDSKWLVESGAARFAFRHYVLVGHDMWIEVLCLDLSWRFCGEASAEAIETDQLQQLADLLNGTKPGTNKS